MKCRMHDTVLLPITVPLITVLAQLFHYRFPVFSDLRGVPGSSRAVRQPPPCLREAEALQEAEVLNSDSRRVGEASRP